MDPKNRTCEYHRPFSKHTHLIFLVIRLTFFKCHKHKFGSTGSSWTENFLFFRGHWTLCCRTKKEKRRKKNRWLFYFVSVCWRGVGGVVRSSVARDEVGGAPAGLIAYPPARPPGAFKSGRLSGFFFLVFSSSTSSSSFFFSLKNKTKKNQPLRECVLFSVYKRSTARWQRLPPTLYILF